MIKSEYPVIRTTGEKDYSIIKFYSTNKQKMLKQVETGLKFVVAVDVYPSSFTYEEVYRNKEYIED